MKTGRPRIPRVTPRPNRLKYCRSCNHWLPIILFNKQRRTPDGRHYTCKACLYERRTKLKNGSPKRKPWHWLYPTITWNKSEDTTQLQG